MIPKDRFVKGADVQDLRELLGHSTLDMFWQTGTMVKDWRVTGEDSQDPIRHPSLAILLRYLSAYPDETFVPKMPSFEETFDLVKTNFPEKLSYRRFGTLWGTSGWSGYAWSHGASPSPTVLRLFCLVVNVILAEGEAGLLKFLDVVETEARVRGMSGGLDELLQKGTWGLRDKKSDKVKDSEDDS